MCRAFVCLLWHFKVCPLVCEQVRMSCSSALVRVCWIMPSWATMLASLRMDRQVRHIQPQLLLLDPNTFHRLLTINLFNSFSCAKMFILLI